MSSILARLSLGIALTALVGWPVLATALEAAQPAQRLGRLLVSLGQDDLAQALARAWGVEPVPSTGASLDPTGTALMLRETGGIARPARLALETIGLVLMTEALVLPAGVLLAILLFRTDVWQRQWLIGLLAVAAFVPLPLHATAWLGALGNVGRLQAIGIRPILVGRFGAAAVHALAVLPWVVLLAGIGLRTVEPELEESAELDLPAWRVWTRITFRRSFGAIAAAAVAAAVFTAGDMTVTDLLQVRTYAEEAYIQFTLGKGPADAAVVTIPPLIVLGGIVVAVAWSLEKADPARLTSAFARSKIWKLGAWRVPLGAFLILVVGNLMALPLYSLLWRAGRVGGRATLGQPPHWSVGGLAGSLRFAVSESWGPLQTSLTLSVIAATITVGLAWALIWTSRGSTLWRALVLSLLALTLAVPGPVAGMALLLAYRWSPLIYDSPAMVVMAQSVRTLPYAILVLWPAIRTLPRDALESAALDGYGPWGQIQRVALPLTRRALIASWFVSFVLALGELPATNLVSPPGVEPITWLIWSLLHTGVESHLAAVALVMLAVAAAAGGLAALSLSYIFRGLAGQDRV